MFEKLLQWLRSLLNQVFQQGDAADIVVSDKMSSVIALWADMYEQGGPWCKGKNGVHSLRVPAAVASEFARLVTVEMEVSLTGSPRAEYLKAQLQPALENIRQYTELGCALGGLVFKPYVTKQGLCIDVVQGDCFYPTAFDTSNRMTGAIFVEQIKRKNAIYTRAEHHEYKDGVHTIRNRAFMSRSSSSIGAPIDLSSVPEWAMLEPEIAIQNVQQPLFAYFRIPQANRKDRHSPLGVSVYAEAVETIQALDEQYERYLWEYEGGQLAVDIAEDLLLHGPEGEVKVPKLQERLYRRRAWSPKGDNFYEAFAPQLRDEAYKRGINTLLQRIEFQAGLAYGMLSDPTDVAKTATEINASKQRAYSTVRDIQKALQAALDDLLYAMDVLATLYKLAPAGRYTVAYDWDDSIINEPSQRKQLFWQYVTAGKFPFWRYLLEFEGYTEEEAKAIEAETTTSMSDPFGFEQGGE